ncbi:MAG: hypothetical protein K2X81_23375, partial [Candidatus Obscuribacterales bacterium]|nr:hypothetical protein [Candidatus Obscuribacterales bacterium]
MTQPMSMSSATIDENPISTQSNHKVLRRDGTVAPFDPGKISVALTKAFLAAEGDTCATSSRMREIVVKLTELVVDSLTRRQTEGVPIHIEHIQDQVELALMRSGEHEVARRYVLYRES